MQLPTVSFIMPVYNRGNVVERALLDVFSERREDYPNIELIVIDGGSTDGTVEILRKYSDQIDAWISEKDRGVADAFNKGLRLARGEIIRYIASDDAMIPGQTRAMIETMLGTPGCDVIGAQVECLNVASDGTFVPSEASNQFESGWFDFGEMITWSDCGVFSFIETWFFKREVIDRVGGLDTQYRIATDVDWGFRIAKAGFKFLVVPRRIIRKLHYADGSNNISNTELMLREHRRIILKHAWHDPRAWSMLYCWPELLHRRLYWKAWLLVGACLRRVAPGCYRKLQTSIGRSGSES